MLLAKMGQRRQVTIPKTVVDEMNLKGGDYFEVCRLNEGELLLRKKTIVDVSSSMTKGVLPTVLPYEERMKLLAEMESDDTDEANDIDTEFIKASRCSKQSTITFDE